MNHPTPARLLAVAALLAISSCTNDPEKSDVDSGGDDVSVPSDMPRDASDASDGAVASDLPGSQDLATPLPDMRRPEIDMGMTMLPAGVCGNGIVETGETCEDCAALSCDDGSACTSDGVLGDPALCLAYCVNEPVTWCEDGDGCCATGCAGRDTDCSATCGDMVVDALETCDGNCPTDCDDGDVATRDVLLGDDASCNVECLHLPIVLCVDGDGFCPAGCLGATDDDCASVCGNGVVELGETCDPPESCPPCADDNPCTTDETIGSAATCDVRCAATPIVACVDGDGCCGPRCDVDDDDDCSPTCGDGVVQPPETCDRPQMCGQITCSNAASCETAVQTGHHQSCNVDCGYVPTTGCTSGDGCCRNGCTAATDSDCAPACGNGVLEAGELCDPQGLCPIACPDDGNACTTVELVGDSATCDAACVVSPVTTCGLDDDCCPANCSANDDPDCVPFCGNGVVEMGELCDGNCSNCDDGDACTIDSRVGSPQTCNVRCENLAITLCGPADLCCPGGVGCNSLLDGDCMPICGNAVLEIGEVCDGNCPASCDDGVACTTNVLNGSASTCDATCAFPAITSCGAADGCCPTTCNANTDPDCTPICGNAVVEPGESCDGNCPASCDDNDACTTDTSSGSSATCDSVCTNTVVTTCVGGDGCCPLNCTSLDDADCP